MPPPSVTRLRPRMSFKAPLPRQQAPGTLHGGHPLVVKVWAEDTWRMTTRTFDNVVATALLLLFAPIVDTTIVAQRLEGRAPVFWRSPRIGKEGETFALLTFCTMMLPEQASAGASPRNRQTLVGRFIRDYSIDGLPMHFNVLRGNLGVIGPRPMDPWKVDLADQNWRRILAVKPGVASYAILRLGRTYNRRSIGDREQLELECVARQSLRFDLAILVESLGAIRASRGNVKSRGKPVR